MITPKGCLQHLQTFFRGFFSGQIVYHYLKIQEDFQKNGKRETGNSKYFVSLRP